MVFSPRIPSLLQQTVVLQRDHRKSVALKRQHELQPGLRRLRDADAPLLRCTKPDSRGIGQQHRLPLVDHDVLQVHVHARLKW